MLIKEKQWKALCYIAKVNSSSLLNYYLVTVLTVICKVKSTFPRASRNKVIISMG